MHFTRLGILLMLSVNALVQQRGSLSNAFISADDIIIYESETVIMSCPIGELDDYVVWKVDNEFHRKKSQLVPGERRITFKGALTRPFELVGRYSVNNNRNYHNLTIVNVNLSEAGNYFCYDQWNTKRQRSIRLHILVNISNLRDVQNKLVSVGDNVIFPCQVNATHNVELLFIASSQAPQITAWNGHDWDEKFTGRILKVTGETFETFNLLMSNIQREDTGYYICIENRGGDKMAHGVFLNVRVLEKYAPQTSSRTAGVLRTLTGIVSAAVISFMLVIIRRCLHKGKKYGLLCGTNDYEAPSDDTGLKNVDTGDTVEGHDFDEERTLIDQGDSLCTSYLAVISASVQLTVSPVPTVPYEVMERILLKAASKLHNTVHVGFRGEFTTLTVMSSVCMEWWYVLMRSRGSKQRARRWLRVYQWLKFPLILQKAVLLFNCKERMKLQKSRDAYVAAFKAVCVCRQWWLTIAANADVNRQQIKRLLVKVPRLLDFLDKDINNIDDNDGEEISRFIDDVDKREAGKVIGSPDNRLQPVPLNHSTEDRGRREVCGLTQVDDKIFVLYNIREYDLSVYGKSLFTVIDVFCNRRPFDRINTIGISQLKDPQDIVACPETLQLFVSGWHSVDIWRVDIETSDCQKFDLRLQYCGDVTSISLSPRRLLVIFSRSLLGVFDVINGDELLLIQLRKPRFSFVYYAIESDKQTFFVSHANESSSGYYFEISEINSGGQLIRSSGRQLGLTCPLHLAFDSIGRLLVADKSSRRISLLNEDLKLERVLLENEEHQPKRLNYNKKTNLLAVGFDDHHSVVIYKWKNSDEKQSNAQDVDKIRITASLSPGERQLMAKSLKAMTIPSMVAGAQMKTIEYQRYR